MLWLDCILQVSHVHDEFHVQSNLCGWWICECSYIYIYIYIYVCHLFQAALLHLSLQCRVSFAALYWGCMRGIYTYAYTYIHFIDPSFIDQWMNMKHIRYYRLCNTTWSRNILNKSIYQSICWKYHKNEAESQSEHN